MCEWDARCNGVNDLGELTLSFVCGVFMADDEGNPVFSEEESSWIMGIMP